MTKISQKSNQLNECCLALLSGKHLKLIDRLGIEPPIARIMHIPDLSGLEITIAMEALLTFDQFKPKKLSKLVAQLRQEFPKAEFKYNRKYEFSNLALWDILIENRGAIVLQMDCLFSTRTDYRIYETYYNLRTAYPELLAERLVSLINFIETSLTPRELYQSFIRASLKSGPIQTFFLSDDGTRSRYYVFLKNYVIEANPTIIHSELLPIIEGLISNYKSPVYGFQIQYDTSKTSLTFHPETSVAYQEPSIGWYMLTGSSSSVPLNIVSKDKKVLIGLWDPFILKELYHQEHETVTPLLQLLWQCGFSEVEFRFSSGGSSPISIPLSKTLDLTILGGPRKGHLNVDSQVHDKVMVLKSPSKWENFLKRVKGVLDSL